MWSCCVLRKSVCNLTKSCETWHTHFHTDTVHTHTDTVHTHTDLLSSLASSYSVSLCCISDVNMLLVSKQPNKQSHRAGGDEEENTSLENLLLLLVSLLVSSEASVLPWCPAVWLMLLVWLINFDGWKLWKMLVSDCFFFLSNCSFKKYF